MCNLGDWAHRKWPLSPDGTFSHWVKELSMPDKGALITSVFAQDTFHNRCLRCAPTVLVREFPSSMDFHLFDLFTYTPDEDGGVVLARIIQDAARNFFLCANERTSSPLHLACSISQTGMRCGVKVFEEEGGYAEPTCLPCMLTSWQKKPPVTISGTSVIVALVTQLTSSNTGAVPKRPFSMLARRTFLQKGSNSQYATGTSTSLIPYEKPPIPVKRDNSLSLPISFMTGDTCEYTAKRRKTTRYDPTFGFSICPA
jgi:hypothetical protein